MRDGGRIAAAAEVIDNMASRHRTAAQALKDWGLSHRFAGSGDRAAIGNLVFDALRKRSSLAAAMEKDCGRALALATYSGLWGNDIEHVEVVLACDKHSAGPLTDRERTGLRHVGDPDFLNEAPDHVRGDYPEWLDGAFAGVFGDDRAQEGAALAERAPVDLRVNLLKTNRDKAATALKRFSPQEASFSPFGLRLAAGTGSVRAPNVQADAAYQRGRVEIQDEASQIAAILALETGARQVGDLCAGAGGKTLALAALMGNKGQIYAYDSDANRLAPIHDRLKRAGARNAQVLGTAAEALESLHGKLDVALVDAPCTGTGVWRRRPDAKWRLTEANLAERKTEQIAVLDGAAPTLRTGGVLVYATCSVLPEENAQQVDAFLQRNAGFEPVDPRSLATERLGEVSGQQLLERSRTDRFGVTLSPLRTQTDGFYVAALRKVS